MERQGCTFVDIPDPVLIPGAAAASCLDQVVHKEVQIRLRSILLSQ